MRLHDLGPLEVTVGDVRERIHGRRPATILTLLAVHANQLVPVDAVIDAVWGDAATPGASSTLDSHVFRLRKQLEPTRTAGEAPAVLLKQEDGFRLRVGVEQLDSLAFAALLEEAGASAAAGRYGECVDRCDAALALWRGSPGGTAAEADWAAAWVARMTELRAQMHERRLDALIRSGHPERALPEFDALIQDSPYREHLHALRMVALYRCGRTENALAAYDEIRRTLRDELGLTPGPELRQVQQQILEHDLGPAPTPAAPAPAPQVHLPTTITALLGRETDLARVEGLLAEHRLMTLTGTAGAGKTRLAVEVARRCAGRHPDGVWFVDLAPLGAGEPIAEAVLSAVGGTGAMAVSAEEALRASVADRRMLVVVDNCEHVLSEAADTLTVLLGGAGVTVLATSREQLDLDGELIYPVEPLADAAVELFLERLASAAPQTVAAFDPADLRRRAVEICTALDGLPLAIELAAARARAYSLDEIRDQIRSDPTQLARIGRPGAPRRQSLQSALEWGHRLLTSEEQRVHRRLAALPGPFSLDAAAAVVGLSPVETSDLLPRLVNRSLLTSSPTARRTLFRQLVVVRGHAARALTRAGETEETLDRRDDWVADLATVASRTDRLDLRRRYLAVDDDYAAVRAMLQRCLVERPSRAGARTAGWLHGYWYYRSRLVEAVRWLELAVDALDSGSEPIDGAWVHLGLAKMLAHQGRLDAARRHSALGLAVADRLPPEHVGAFGLDVAIQAGNLWSAGDPETGRELLARTAELAPGDPVLDVLTDATRSLVESDLTDARTTLLRAEEVYPRARALELDVAAWMVARAGSYAALTVGAAATGMLWSERVIELHLREGGELGGAFVEMRANFLALAGDHRAAVTLYSAARAQRYREGLEWRAAPETDGLRERARAALSAGEYEKAWHEGAELTLGDIVRASGRPGEQAVGTANRSTSRR